MVRPVAGEVDERDLLVAAWGAQRQALRRAVDGLTDQQARDTPSASELSLASLLKHAALGEPPWTPVLHGEGADWSARDGAAEFEVGPEETLDELLRAHAEVAARTDDVVRALPDLDRTVPMPVTPWGPTAPPRPVRAILLDLLVEAARHAGHADIIRESIDGATAPKLAGHSGDPGSDTP